VTRDERPQHVRILELLSDGRPHFSAEFRDRLGLLEYRKPITRLRQQGHRIVALKVKEGFFCPERPAYQLQRVAGEA